jgi:hypothetical protein
MFCLRLSCKIKYYEGYFQIFIALFFIVFTFFTPLVMIKSKQRAGESDAELQSKESALKLKAKIEIDTVRTNNKRIVFFLMLGYCLSAQCFYNFLKKLFSFDSCNFLKHLNVLPVHKR